MNTRLCLLLAGLFALGYASLGQSVDQLVADGRAFLASHDITNANTKFAAAVITSPTDPTANTLYAATRLLTLYKQPSVGAFLDRLGISSTNRDIYRWRTSVPRDTNGVPLAPANMSASEASDLLHTNILHTIGVASTNLANVKNTNFLLALSQKETLAADVTLDYGDVLLLRSMLEFAQYLGYTFTAWNFDTQLAEIRSLITQGALTAQELLQDHPQLFTFATTNDLGSARQSFGNAATLYLSASEFIRNRPTNVTRLFNYDPAMEVSQADFRTTLVDLNQSLKGPVVLTLKTNITMALGNQFDGLHPLRSFLPEFAGNGIIAGTLPDATFGRVVQGLPSYQVEKFLGSVKTVSHARIPATRFLSQFTVPQRLPGGQIKIGVDALDGAFMVIQASQDLRTWTNAAYGTVKQGVLVVSDGTPISRRFYRALDATDATTAQGTLLDVSGQPIANAAVSLGVLGGMPVVTSLTGSNGTFFLFAFLEIYELDISAPGYTPVQLWPYSFSNRHFDSLIYLAPPDYHPPNDNFANRTTLVGTNLTASGLNVGATSESGESVGAGHSVWWTWAAPADGAVTIDTVGSSFSTMLSVFTGNSLSNLTQVDSAYSGNGTSGTVNFFIRSGTAYQIAVDNWGDLPGAIVLNLRVTEPLMPRITQPPQYQSAIAGDFVSFSVAATGTSPLQYQWQRNGKDLLSGTNYWYQIDNVRTNDAGIYTVIVRNAAGSVTSSGAVLSVTIDPVNIRAQPQDQTVRVSQFAYFDVYAWGSLPIYYQWQKDGVNLIGATNDTCQIFNAQITDVGSYRVIVTNVAGSVTSSNAVLKVTP